MAHYRRHMRSPLPLLLCMCVLAPACLAQSRPGDAAQVDAAELSRDGQAPRSAMGRVMGIMIEALRQEAMRSASGEGTARSTGSGNDGLDDASLEIEVGDAFRLPPPQNASASVPARPACDVQPCDRESVRNLRIASQK